MADNFIIDFLASLKKGSKKQIQTDAKNLGDIYVPLIGKLDKTKTRAQLKQDSASINGTVNLTGKFNSKGVTASVQQATSQAQKQANTKPIQMSFTVKKEKLINDIKLLAQQNSRLFKDTNMSVKYNTLLDSAKMARDTVELSALRTQLGAFRSELKLTSNAGLTMTDALKNGLSKVLYLFGSHGIIMQFTTQLRKAWTEAKELDSSMTDLSRVNVEITRSGFPDYLDKVISKTKELSVATKDYIDVVTTFSRAGYSLADSEILADAAVQLEKVGDMSATDASKALLSGIQGYAEIDGYGMDQLIEKAQALNDKIDIIGNTASISQKEVAEGIQAVGSVMADANTSVDEFLSLLGAGNRAVQDSNKVALAIRTSALRIRGCTAELQEMGEETDDVVESTSNLAEKIKALTNIDGSGGVDILEADEETFRSIYDIYNDIAKVYDKMSDTNASALIDLIAGKNRSNQISAILQNMSEANELLDRSLNAAGTASDEYKIYLNSAQAASERFGVAMTETYNNILNGETVKGLTNAGTAVLDFANKWGIVEGSLKGILGLGILKGITTLTVAFKNSALQISNYGTALNTVNKLDAVRGTQKFTEAMNLLKSSCVNLTDTQLKQILSNKSLSNTERVKVLQYQGLTKAQAQAKLAQMGLTQATNAQTKANDKAAASTFSFSSAVKGLGAKFKSFLVGNKVTIAIMAISAAISFVTSAISKHNQKLEEARQAAQEAAKEYKETASSIDEYVKKYNDLRTALINAKGNEEETYNIKKQLLELQTELNDKFGEEYGKINLVTEAYKDQTEAIKNYNKEAANEFLNENRKEIDDAKKVMERKYTYSLSLPLTDDREDNKEVLGLVKKYKDKGMFVKEGEARTDDYGFIDTRTIYIEADPQTAYDTINEFETDVRNLAKELGDEHLFDYDVLNDTDSALKDTKDKLENNKELYEQAQMMTIAADTNLSKGYNEATSAVEKFNEAVLKSEDSYNDKNVKAAWEDMQKLKQEMLGDEDWAQYSNILDNVFSAATDKAYEFYNVLQNDFSIKGLLGELNGLSDTDLLSMSNDGVDGGNYDAFDKLYEKAQKYGLEVQELINLLIRLGVVHDTVAEKAVNDEKNQKQSFSEAWKFIGTTGTDEENKKLLEEKDKILELAEAGKLTRKALENSSLAEIFEKAGVSIEEATKKINEMKSSASQLASMKTGISSISSILGEKNENLSSKKTRTVGIGADTLNGMPEDIKAQTEEYENFIKVLGNGTSTMEECKDAANKLATAYVTSNNFLANLTEGNKAYYTSVLEEMGVKNAAKIVDDTLTASRQAQELKTEALTAATEDMGKETSIATDEFIKQANASDLARIELGNLIATEKIFANQDMNTSDKVKELNKLAMSYFKVSDAIQICTAMGNDSRYWNSPEDYEAAIEDAWNKLVEQQTKLITSTDIDVGTSKGSKDKSKKSKSTPAKTEINWLERRLTRMQDIIDLTASKLKNLFSIDDRQNNISKQIKQTTKLIKQYEIAADRYTKKAKKVAKASTVKEDGKKKKVPALSKDIIEKIKSGKITKDSYNNLIKKYGKNYADKINEYIDYYDKAQNAEKSAEEKRAEKRQLKKDKIQVKVDDYESNVSLLEQQKENATTASKKNDYLNKEKDIYNDIYKQKIKIAKLDKDNYEVQRLKAEQAAKEKEIEIEKHQNSIDELENHLDLLDAQKENATTASEKNAIINQELETTKEIYEKRKAIARLEGNTDEENRLDEEYRANEKQSRIDQHQNIIDELEPSLELKSAQKENAKTAAEKINLTNDELEITKEIYERRKKIAELDDNPKEVDRLDEELKSQEKQYQTDKVGYIKDEHDLKLNALERDKSDTDARIKKNEALGVGQSRKDYKEQIEQSKNRRKILEDERESLERYLAEQIRLGNIVADETDPAYKALRDSISECSTGISDCITEQIEFNKAIDNMDLENYKSLIDLLEKGNNIYKRFKSLAEVHGSTLSDDDLFEQIGINDKIINGYEGFNAELAKDIKRDLMNPEILGLAEEQADKIVDIAKNSPGDLSAYMESLGIKDFNEQHFPELFENINKLHDNIDTMYEKRVENENLIDDYLDNHISKINDYLDALKKEKDIKDRTLAIEKAQYELNKAKNNLTKKVWDGSQWVYTSDTDAVQSAQEAFDNAQYDELVNVLEDLVEALEKFKTEDLNLYDDYGNQINSVDGVKEMAKPYNDVIDKVLGDIDMNKIDLNQALADYQERVPLTYDIPNYEPPKYSNTTNHNVVNISKIENNFPNVTNESSAKDLIKELENQLLNFGNYAMQYDWEKKK